MKNVYDPFIVDNANKTIKASSGDYVYEREYNTYTKNMRTFPQRLHIVRGENPLAYVAEYNINKTGDGFVKNKYATNVSGYYNFDTAIQRFGHISLYGKAYHLPSYDEWKSIVPSEKPTWHIKFDEPVAKENFSETVVIAGNTVNCVQDFSGSGNNVCYARRFKGTKYESAWKYEYVRVNGYQVLRITARNISPRDRWYGDYAREGFWCNNTENDIVRIFPASGWVEAGASTPIQKNDGSFISSTRSNGPYNYIVLVNPFWAASRDGSLNSSSFSVRLFKDEL